MLSRVPTPADHDISLRATVAALAVLWVAFMGLDGAGLERAAAAVRVGGGAVAIGLVLWHAARYRYETQSQHHPT